jgi:hypothetical protein
MTIAEFDKLHDMLRVIHEENQMILQTATNGKVINREYVTKHFNKAFSEAEKGRLKKWEDDGEKLD